MTSTVATHKAFAILPDYVALNQAILDDPTDELPRLALADLLEEVLTGTEAATGQTPDACLLRLIRGTPLTQPKYQKHSLAKSGMAAVGESIQATPIEGSMNLITHDAYRAWHPTVWPLIGGGKRGQAPTGGPIAGPTRWALGAWDGGSLSYTEIGRTGQGLGGVPHKVIIALRVGFPSTVVCPWEAWRDHGKALAQALPLEKVTLTDRRPCPSIGWGWFGGNLGQPEDLDTNVWALLDGDDVKHFTTTVWKWYSTRELAVDALSRALIKWAQGDQSV